MENIRSHKQLRVYQAAIEAAMRIFEIIKRFPPEERFFNGRSNASCFTFSLFEYR